MIIREMTSSDIESVKAIEDVLYKSPWTSTMFLNEINNNKFAHLFVLENDEEIIGYSGVWIIADSATITKVTVARKHQGKGYANKLMIDLVERAIEAKCAYISLEVRVSNRRAYELYKKFGFEQVAIRKKYYTDGEDAYAMVKYFNKGENNE